MTETKTLTQTQLKRKLASGTHEVIVHGKYKGRAWKSTCYPDYSVSYSTDQWTHYNCTEIPLEDIFKTCEYIREVPKGVIE